MRTLALCILQAVVLVAIAPLLNGLVRRLKALFQRRVGPPLLQQYFDVWKLFAKEQIRPTPASWIFDAAPLVALASAIVAAALVPTWRSVPGLGLADVLTILYVLALGRFFLALAGFDAASSFGGLGSSRDVTVSVFAEPVAILALATLAAALGTSTDGGELAAHAGDLLAPWRLLAALAFAIVVLAECARVPFDNPATHLELTMIHEAMLLEFSGRPLALLTVATLTKQVVLISILVTVFFPVGVAVEATVAGIVLAVLVYAVKLGLAALALAVIESTIAKVRFLRVPDYLGFALGLALLAYVAREAL